MIILLTIVLQLGFHQLLHSTTASLPPNITQGKRVLTQEKEALKSKAASKPEVCSVAKAAPTAEKDGSPPHQAFL
jgi:hypothetical protein